jgi:hypothetical protein
VFFCGGVVVGWVGGGGGGGGGGAPMSERARMNEAGHV